MSEDHPEYREFLEELKQRIRSAQVRAALAVNRELILLYWSIGRDLSSRFRSGVWGSKIVDRLARDLQSEFPGVEGFSPRNLRYMRTFAEAWPDREMLPQLVATLPWGHQRVLLDRVKDSKIREWYLRSATEHGWSRNVLVHQIATALHERQGKALTNFSRALPPEDSELAQEVLKDPYNFDFLTLAESAKERDVERGLLEHLRDLLMELGRGFSFVGSQVPLEVDGRSFYIDLLFYHLRLHCYFVFELKIGEFEPEHAGKLNFYISAVDGTLKTQADGPTIGVLLCESRSGPIVEYALQNLIQPIGVSTYRLTRELPERLQAEAPSIEDLQAVVGRLRLGNRLPATKFGTLGRFDAAPFFDRVEGVEYFDVLNVEDGIHAKILKTKEGAWRFSVTGKRPSKTPETKPPTPGDDFQSDNEALEGLRQYLSAYYGE